MSSKQAPQDIHPKVIGKLSLQSLTWLRDRQIPAKPVAYSIAFEYNHNINPDFVKRVDAAESDQPLDNEALDQLFREFILAKFIDFDNFNQSVTGIVDETGAAVTEARDQLIDFKAFLREARAKLEKLTDETTKSLVNDLITNTSTTTES
ncbi:MAG: hypothetical protein V2I33_12625, partial [Kangiellaceae bacterium]|nr:hypothetical protein [Kangiellaceae bacterium]